MKLQRYNLGELAKHYASDKDNVVCRAYDVEKLEKSHNELLNVLQQMVAVYSGQLQNDGNYTVIDTLARVAITNAEGTNQ